MKVIETRYQGHRFRSRLEARWAVFFDCLNIKWHYEPEGYETDHGWYLPDFLITVNDQDFWVEIKGRNPTRLEQLKLMDVCHFTETCGLVLTDIPAPWAYETVLADYFEPTTLSPFDVKISWHWNDLQEWFERDFNCDFTGLYGADLKAKLMELDNEYYFKKYGIAHPYHFKKGIVHNVVEFLNPPLPLNRAVTKARSARFEHGEHA